MTHMMQRCADWMMSLGWIGMVLGFVLLVALIALAVMAITRIGRGSRP